MNGMSPVSGRARALVSAFIVVVAAPAAAEPSVDPVVATSVAMLEPSSAGSTAASAAGAETAAATRSVPERSVGTGDAESKDAAPIPTATATASPVPAATPTEDLAEGDEVVVIGRRSRTRAERDRTASATIITADRFAGEAKGVAELVATAPGVAVNDYGGLGRLATASIRGSTADGVLVLLDGIPLGSSFGGGVDLSSIPRGWIERIEVVRGMEGAHYGAGALGGVVNVVTRRAAAQTWSAELMGGSFGTGAASVDRGFGLGGGALLVAASVDGTQGRFPYQHETRGAFDRAHNGSLRGGGLAKFALPLGRVHLDGLAELSGGDRDLPPDPGTDLFSSNDWQRDARGLFALRAVAPTPLAGLSIAGRGSLRVDQMETRLAGLGGTVRVQRGGLGSGGAEAILAHAGGLLRVDAAAETEWLDAGEAGGGARSRARVSAAVSEELRLADGRLRIAPAARWDRIGPHDGVSAKLGATAGVWGPLSVRASAGQTFRPPSFAELYLQQGIAQPNPDLRSEKGVGADGALVVEGALGMASVGGHVTRYTDLVVWEPGSFGRLKPQNTGRSFLGGVEVEGASAPIRSLAGLSLSGAYTWLRSENLRAPEGTAGQDLPRRPRHRAYARASIAPGPVQLHVESHYVGRQWQDARNVDDIPATLLWNAGASVAVDRARRFAVALEVRNALDDRTLQDPLASPMPGRMVMLSIRGSSRAEVTP